MPDTGLKPPSRSHTSTLQWQGFEVRMRRRRLERCLLRAEVALEAGFPHDARVALEEARRLDPAAPQIDQLDARMRAALVSPPAPPVRRVGRYALIAAAAALAVAAATLLSIQRPIPPVQQPDAVEAAAPLPQETPRPVTVGIMEQLVRADVVRPVPETPPAEPARPAPPPARAETPNPQPAAPPVETAVASPPESIPVAAPAALPAVAEPTPEPAREVADLPPPAPVATRGAPAPPPAPDPVIDDVARVRAVLSRYEAAYSGLDASAARAIWPAVDERALARAFSGLASQRVSLDRCDVSVTGASARAVCDGSATWVPKVGGGGRTEARRWSFDLRQSAGAWQIVRADAR